MQNPIGLHKFQLQTPCLVIDKHKLDFNLRLMQKLALDKGVSLRPHAKTHKCSKVARLQLEYGALGICVTKVSEALVMAKAGIRGILITSPIVAINKIDILCEVLRIAPDTMVVVDNIENVRRLDEYCLKHGLILSGLIDIDGGVGRTGVAIDHAFELALQLLEFPRFSLKGIQCYAGHLQHISDINERRKQSHAILIKAGALRSKLLEHGLEDCFIQTGSGTGTFSLDAELDSVTEIQPGSYCIMDQEYMAIEYKEQQFLPAMTMLTTVISSNQLTHVTVDAGTKALYKVATKPRVISHYGLEYDWDCFGDEHGKIRATNARQLPILGDVLELIVAHCDPTINLFDCFYITENDIVVDCWTIDARGCCQ